jgi:hypothetical protein
VLLKLLLSAYLFKLAFRNSPTLDKAVERGTFASCDRNLSRFCTSAAADAITMLAVEFVMTQSVTDDRRAPRLRKDGLTASRFTQNAPSDMVEVPQRN